jgi:diacylglycerol kinase (ATP)
MKALFVINPVAGGKDHRQTIHDVEQISATNGYESDFVLTDGKGDQMKLMASLQRFLPDRVIAGGGDGTIRMVAESLIEFKLPMGILPLGSANGFAKALGIPIDPTEAVGRALRSNVVRKTDMLRFNNDHLCIHLADVGVNALIVKKYEEAGERGIIGYAKNLLTSIQESPPLKIIVRTPDGIATKEGYMMAFANAHKYGTGVHISEGSVSDGKFEICNVEKIALDEAIKAGLTILNVFVDKNMFSDVISCTEAEIEIDKKLIFRSMANI